jgi:dipeptidyl aminopeptidase/acylaminoacyl peptidase
MNGDLWVLPLAGDAKPYPFLQSPFNEGDARFSPDGRWVAFASDESGQSEVYVARFENPREKWRVSTSGGRSPRWRRDGKELFYFGADERMMSVPVRAGGGGFEFGAPTPLFRVTLTGGDYDVAADGQRFLVSTGVAGAQSSPFNVVLDWAAGLKR